MEEIGLHNYEAFLLDYLEGNLSGEDLARLKAFAMANPQLEIDLGQEALPVLERDLQHFEGKDHLKKTETDVLNETILNYLEGNLSEAERKAFESKILTDSVLASELALFRKTVLKAGSADAFENKRTLYKTENDLLLSNRALAYFENELPAADRPAFEAELKTSKALQAELELISKTRLTADTRVEYPDKNGLKKEGRVIALFGFKTMDFAAAAVLLLAGLLFIFTYYGSHKKSGTELAGTKKPTARTPATTKNAPAKETSGHLPAENKLAEKAGQTFTRVQAKKEKEAPVLNKTQRQAGHVLKQEEPANLASENNSHKESETKIFKEEPVPQKEMLAGHNPASDQNMQPHKDSLLRPSVSDTKQIVVMTVEESDDDADQTPAKKGFWHRAVSLAHRANTVGIKAVDGEERDGQRFSLSFSSFSVEKR